MRDPCSGDCESANAARATSARQSAAILNTKGAIIDVSWQLHAEGHERSLLQPLVLSRRLSPQTKQGMACCPAMRDRRGSHSGSSRGAAFGFRSV